MRLLIDTHIFLWYAKKRDRLSRNVKALIEDLGNQVYVSAESLREFVLLWKNKKDIQRLWQSPQEMIRAVEDVYDFQILYLKKEQYEQYAHLRPNEAQAHYDPSDHMIIAHAICNRLPLISADEKFPFYREQGLELIDNG